MITSEPRSKCSRQKQSYNEKNSVVHHQWMLVGSQMRFVGVGVGGCLDVSADRLITCVKNVCVMSSANPDLDSSVGAFSQTGIIKTFSQLSSSWTKILTIIITRWMSGCPVCGAWVCEERESGWVATIPKLGIQTNNHRQMTMIAMKAQGSDRHSHTMRVVLRLFYA